MGEKEVLVAMESSGHPEPTASSTPSLADKLNRLFEVASSNRGRSPSNRTVAEAISARGTTISEASIYYLRTGSRDNPSKRHLEGLARYFEVPVAYFHDDDPSSQRIYEELPLIAAMRDADVRTIAMRGANMSPQMRRWLINTLAGLADAQQVLAPLDKPGGAGDDSETDPPSS